MQSEPQAATWHVFKGDPAAGVVYWLGCTTAEDPEEATADVVGGIRKANGTDFPVGRDVFVWAVPDYEFWPVEVFVAAAEPPEIHVNLVTP